MSHFKLKTLLLATSLIAATHAIAAISQSPLLSRATSVPPNLLVVLDTSGSMNNNYIYRYGPIDTLGNGLLGPDDKTYAQYSPDVNEIYYNPKVRYLPRIDYLGNYYPTSTSTANWKTYFRRTTGPYTQTQLGSAADYYNPYTPPASEVVPGSTATYPVDTATATSSTQFPKFIARSDCLAATYCTRAEERQNHKNWVDWYDSRGGMAVTGIMAAFSTLKPGAIRLGYGTIGQLDGGNLARGMGLFGDPTLTPPAVEAVTGNKALFMNWLEAQTFTTSTPNLTAINNAGKYYERKDSDGPWATLPNGTSTGITTVATPTGPGASEARTDHASCRRSFTMLITDGYSNGAVPTTAGNADNVGFSISPAVGLPFVYTPSAPYRDAANSNTMADIAMYYWGRDLRTGADGIANRVPKINTVSVQNPSTWQNVSFYAVTLGIDGTLPQTAATRANLNSGAINWPAPVNNTPSTIDDLWHATINGRGEMLNASNSGELTNGLKRMFETIAGVPETLSGVAVSAEFLRNGTRKYKPEYVPGTWSGKLSAIELDGTTGNDKVPTNTFWQVEQGVNAATQDPISLIDPPATRQSKVFTWNGSSAVAFNASNTGLSTDMVNYILGDSSKELRKAGGIYRNRAAKLGDIVNSSPAYILGNVDLNYERLVGTFGIPGSTDYRSFVNAKQARSEGVLFVGANDGMLHAFGDNAGTEYFAYVPQAVVPNLYKLSETPYTHQYYVDGPLTETDAFLDGAWKNILLGTTGAGGKAVFAMDVTSPTTMNASKVLWEVNSSTANFGNLGHILFDVQAGKVAATGAANDDWVGIFGNGVGSTSGYASLFVVNLKTGARLRELVVDTSGSNGLGGVQLVRDSTEKVIGAYAGDLKGNVWKFDLTGSNAAAWKVGLGGSPLYAAGATQAITATPAVVPHPLGGYVVNFGAGKLYEQTDITPTPPATVFPTQRVFGVWDKQPFNGAATAPAGASLNNTALLQQQVIGSVMIGSTTWYTITANTVNWGDGLTGTGAGGGNQRGWYIDLPNNGERVVYPIERQRADISTRVLLSTLSPASVPGTDICVQSSTGLGWTYTIDGVTGSGATKPAFDTNGDGLINDNDAIVSGYSDPVDGRPTPISISSTPTNERGCIVTAQNRCVAFELKCGQPGMPACPNPAPGNATVKKREWRQLFMR